LQVILNIGSRFIATKSVLIEGILIFFGKLMQGYLTNDLQLFMPCHISFSISTLDEKQLQYLSHGLSPTNDLNITKSKRGLLTGLNCIPCFNYRDTER
jgi:hypothetical protein